MKWTSFVLATLLTFSSLSSEEEPTPKQTRTIKIEITLECPPSEELDALLKTFPIESTNDVNFEEWSQSFLNMISQLVPLVQSGKLENAGYEVDPWASL